LIIESDAEGEERRIAETGRLPEIRFENLKEQPLEHLLLLDCRQGKEIRVLQTVWMQRKACFAERYVIET